MIGQTDHRRIDVGTGASRRAVLSGLGALGLAGCTGRPARLGAPAFVTPPLAPLRMSADRIIKTTVCLRPFRAAGPRMDVETIGAKRVVHNYGHGGSGWSLSWGSAEIAARNALSGGARDVAVIGCGAIGLTTALTLQRAGANVTIYTKDRPPETRSARATGTWSPDSRIADGDAVDAAFPALWEAMARASFRMHEHHVGLAGDPVVWSDRYSLSGGGAATPAEMGSGRQIHFAEYGHRLDDIVPGFQAVPAGRHPFPGRSVRHGVAMQFNVTEYAHRLTMDFLAEGGRIVPMTFASPADLARLPQPVVVNCTGYGARALWRDDTIIPVRGQITWLAPQPEVRYGLSWRRVSVLPRPDGIVVQNVGPDDMWGYDVADERPDRAESEAAIATIAQLFAPPAL